MTLYEIVLYFFIYGFLGWCVEVAFAAVKEKKFVNRGFLNGPICPIYGIGVVCVVWLVDAYVQNLALLYVMSVFVVTALEWLTGYLLEQIFHRKWWDYSDMPFNLNGYVCLLFSLVWGVACVLIVRFLHVMIGSLILRIPVWMGIVAGVALGILLAADLYVTVSGILKMNRKLEHMKIIAEELHHLSDYLGNNLSKGTLELEATVEANKAKARELKRKYQELMEKQSQIEQRVLSAFPKMRSNRNPKQFQELKEFLHKRKGK